MAWMMWMCFWMNLRGKYQRSNTSRIWTGHSLLRAQDGGVCTRVSLMIGTSVGGWWEHALGSWWYESQISMTGKMIYVHTWPNGLRLMEWSPNLDGCTCYVTPWMLSRWTGTWRQSSTMANWMGYSTWRIHKDVQLQRWVWLYWRSATRS